MSTVRMRTLALLALVAVTASGQPRALRDARKHLAVGRYADALSALEKLRGRQANEDPVLRMKLVAWRGLGQPDKVADVGVRWLARNAGDAEMQIWVGQALVDLAVAEGRLNLRAQGLCEEAGRCADAALKVDPALASAFELKAVSLINTGRPEDAVTLMKATVAKHPGNADFRVVHARVLNWTGSTGAAIGALNEAAKRLPGMAAIPLERAAIHVEAQQRDEAVRALAEAVACRVMARQQDELAGYLLWETSGKYGQFDEGMKTAATWARAHPKSGKARWWVGYFFERQGKVDAAMKAYRESFKVGATPEAAYHLGLLLGQAGKEAEALKMVEAALEGNVVVREGTMAPADALIMLGRLYVSERNYEKAVKVLGVGGDYLTGHYELQQNLGFCYRELGTQQSQKKKTSLARRTWKKSAHHYELAAAAVRVADVDGRTKAQVLNDTGLMFHYHLNQLGKGIRYYEEALEFHAEYVDALENMGVAMLKKKKWEQAIGWFDKVLAKQPSRGASLRGKEVARTMLARKRR